MLAWWHGACEKIIWSPDWRYFQELKLQEHLMRHDKFSIKMNLNSSTLILGIVRS